MTEKRSVEVYAYLVRDGDGWEAVSKPYDLTARSPDAGHAAHAIREAIVTQVGGGAPTKLDVARAVTRFGELAAAGSPASVTHRDVIDEVEVVTHFRANMEHASFEADQLPTRRERP